MHRKAEFSIHVVTIYTVILGVLGMIARLSAVPLV